MYLRDIVREMKEWEKFVVLLWDEKLLQLVLFFDKKQDRIIGFEDFDTKRNRKIADHAFTSYFKSLKKGKKMPLGYGFCIFL